MWSLLRAARRWRGCAQNGSLEAAANRRSKCKRDDRRSLTTAKVPDVKPSEVESGSIWDVIIVGAGHNGLIAAAYLGLAGYKVVVVEKRGNVGGLMSTEEIIPGYRFSRANDVAGSLRPQIVADLKLDGRRDLELQKRNPWSVTPLRDGSQFLMLGPEKDFNRDQIAKFSRRDAEGYEKFQAKLQRLLRVVEPLLDEPPIDLFSTAFDSPLGLRDKFHSASCLARLLARCAYLGSESMDLFELLSAPASRVLSRELESEPLRVTLARQGLSGSLMSPNQPGSSILLLYHLLGNVDGERGHWAYVRGGVGAMSAALASAAIEGGVKISVDSPVKNFDLDNRGHVQGVELEDGKSLHAPVVISNADPRTTFLSLCPRGSLDREFENDVRSLDFSSSLFKINVALSGLPTFKALPRGNSSSIGPEHGCSIYLGAESVDEVHAALLDSAVNCRPSQNPIVEMKLPTAMDATLAPKDHHIASLTVQYAPYNLPWNDPNYKKNFVEKVLSLVDDYAPNFSRLVVGYDAMTPRDLESIYGVSLGHVYHGALTPDQLYCLRPVKRFARYRSPVPNLYMCGAGTHPAGGLTGASGRNCANIVRQDLRKRADGNATWRGFQSTFGR